MKQKQLPRTLMITGSDPTQTELFVSKCITHFQYGIKLVQLRAKELQEKAYRNLAERVITEAKRYNVQVILNCELGWMQGLDAAGLHLSSSRLMQITSRPISNHYLLSAACHNQEQLVHAQNIGVDLVTLSPVHATLTHLGVSPLGWEKFAALCKTISLPIYALGGITPTELTKARTFGAYGFAAIRSLWDREN